MARHRLPLIVIPAAALIAIVPLLLRGCSCGHDFDFHVLNWLEAARQFQQGNLHPHWTYSPAWNAGEPRFVFYPPLSWTVGAILGLLLPWTATPIAYTWLVLAAAGLSLYYVARSFTHPQAALLAATFYIVNPYMLFTAYERGAYAELLAAVWVPLLLHAILRERIAVSRIAIPVALLWLSNAPAAVMSCYTLALLAALRVSTTIQGTPHTHPQLSSPAAHPIQHRLRLAFTTIGGTLLGLALAAFYVLPAAYEQRYVQIAMAVVPGLSPAENFLFHHTIDPDHDRVLHAASLIAVILLALTAIALLSNLLNLRRATKSITIKLALLTLTITLLLTPLSAPIWRHLPELRFLQFPWRLLAILAPALSLAIALALAPLKLKSVATTALALIVCAALSYPAYLAFQQRCYPEDTVPSVLSAFRAHQGFEPTDEYTPVTADNESLSDTSPPFWLSADPHAPAPNAATPGPAPLRLTVDAPIPETLILNLRDYPAWRITSNGSPIHTRLHRADGLIAFPIPAGHTVVAVTYVQTTDQMLGYIITAIACITLLLIHLLQRRPSRVPIPTPPTQGEELTLAADLSSNPDASHRKNPAHLRRSAHRRSP